jgi:hypothetical protein
MVPRVRRWLLWILLLGLVGTEVELLLLEHYDGATQVVPVALLAIALVAVIWHMGRPGAASLRTLVVLMVLFLGAGAVGIGLHFRGAAAFQRETDPSIGTRELIAKAMRSKAPPVLAPGVMLQLGLIGLLYTLLDSTVEPVERSDHS